MPTNIIFCTPRFNVCHFHETIGETPKEHYYIDKPDAVTIIIRHTEHVLLLKLKRLLTQDESYELPGGRIEPGETPEGAAKRELAEETGVAVERLDLMLTLMPLPSLTNEKTYIFTTEVDQNADITNSPGALDEGIIGASFVSLKIAAQFVKDGKVVSAIDACAILFLTNMLAMR